MTHKPLPFRYHDDGINPNGPTIVLSARGRRFVVFARPMRRPAMGGGFTSGPLRKIPPGGCDVYEGENGSQYICCKSADGAFINCYKIAIHHQDPWRPPLP